MDGVVPLDDKDEGSEDEHGEKGPHDHTNNDSCCRGCGRVSGASHALTVVYKRCKVKKTICDPLCENQPYARGE